MSNSLAKKAVAVGFDEDQSDSVPSRVPFAEWALRDQNYTWSIKGARKTPPPPPLTSAPSLPPPRLSRLGSAYRRRFRMLQNARVFVSTFMLHFRPANFSDVSTSSRPFLCLLSVAHVSSLRRTYGGALEASIFLSHMLFI